MRMVPSRFVGGPHDGEVHDTPGAAWHFFARLSEDQARYVRRPRLEHGQFVYDWTAS